MKYQFQVSTLHNSTHISRKGLSGSLECFPSETAAKAAANQDAQQFKQNRHVLYFHGMYIVSPTQQMHDWFGPEYVIYSTDK